VIRVVKSFLGLLMAVTLGASAAWSAGWPDPQSSAPEPAGPQRVPTDQLGAAIDRLGHRGASFSEGHVTWAVKPAHPPNGEVPRAARRGEFAS